jgi:hypothetical protein
MVHKAAMVSKKVGNATLIGTRPAISQAPNNATTEIMRNQVDNEIRKLAFWGAACAAMVVAMDESFS